MKLRYLALVAADVTAAVYLAKMLVDLKTMLNNHQIRTKELEYNVDALWSEVQSNSLNVDYLLHVHDEDLDDFEIVVPDGDPEALITEVKAVQHPGLFDGKVHYDIVCETDDGETFRLGRCDQYEKLALVFEEFEGRTRSAAKALFLKRLSDMETPHYPSPTF